MASIIRLKRSGVSGSPSALAQGEIAYSYLVGSQANGGDRLYIGTGTENANNEAANIEVIGGKYFTDMLDHVHGTLTASSAIITNSSNKIDVLNVDNITINGNEISSTDIDGNIALNPNGTGLIDASSTRIINVVDPSSNQDAATKKYVDDQVIASSNSNFTFIGDTGSDTIPSGSSINFYGNTGISTTVSDQQIDIDLDDTAVTPGSYGSSTEIATFTVDQQGRLTAAGTATISTDLLISGDSGSDAIPSSNTLNFTGGSNITTAVSNNDVSIALDSDVSGLTSLAVDNITINGNAITSTNTDGDITLTPNGTGSVVISSDLIIQGNTVTVNSNEVNIGDAIILLNSDEVGAPSQNGGIEIERGTSANKSLVWDETADKWTVGSETFVAGTFEGDLSGNAGTATALETSRNFSITGDVVANAISFDGSGNVVLSATIQANSVALGTDTTGDYVASVGVTAGTGLSVSGSGEGASITLSGINATTSVKGVASFSSSNFAVASGAVSITAIDGGTY